MKQLVAYKLDGDETIVVEVELPQSGIEAVGRGDVIVNAAQSFDQALEQLKPAAQKIIEKLSSLSPNEITVEFGIKLSAKAGVVIASADTEANFTVTLAWKRETAPVSATG